MNYFLIRNYRINLDNVFRYYPDDTKDGFIIYIRSNDDYFYTIFRTAEERDSVIKQLDEITLRKPDLLTL